MNAQADRARAFAEAHRKGRPIVLYNIWDAGSAKTAADAGVVAVATGSWSVAAAQGYPDGEQIPLDLLMIIVERIVSTVDVPVSVDIEGGYGPEPSTVSRTTERVLDAGAVGINFEDRIVQGNRLYSTGNQAARIRVIRQVADARQMPLYINARTDLFLNSKNEAEHPALLKDAISRADAYRDAGASGFFAPGLIDEALIAELCDASPLPVNIMMQEGAPSPRVLADLGVSRISHGPLPYVRTMQTFRDSITGHSELMA